MKKPTIGPTAKRKPFCVPITATKLYPPASRMIKPAILDWLLDNTLGDWSLVPNREGPEIRFEQRIDAQVFATFWA